MPAEFYYPLSTAPASIPGGFDGWTNVGGANKNASARPGGGRAGPMTHDDDTSYVGLTTDGGTHSQAFNPDWPGPIGTVEAITLGMQTKGNGGAAARACRFVNAGGTEGSVVASDSSGAGYTTAGPSDAMSARPGGGSWTAADMADSITMFPEVQTSAAGAIALFDTSIWGLLTYTTPSGGFAFLLQLAGLGALPFVGAMSDFGQFTRYLSWRRRFHPRHTILTGAEVRRAWRELREYRHPRFFLPAAV